MVGYVSSRPKGFSRNNITQTYSQLSPQESLSDLSISPQLHARRVSVEHTDGTTTFHQRVSGQTAITSPGFWGASAADGTISVLRLPLEGDEPTQEAFEIFESQEPLRAFEEEARTFVRDSPTLPFSVLHPRYSALVSQYQALRANTNVDATIVDAQFNNIKMAFETRTEACRKAAVRANRIGDICVNYCLPSGLFCMGLGVMSGWCALIAYMNGRSEMILPLGIIMGGSCFISCLLSGGTCTAVAAVSPDLEEGRLMERVARGQEEAERTQYQGERGDHDLTIASV